MSQRNNFETAELPPRAGSSGVASTGQDAFANDTTSSRTSSTASRMRRAARIPVSLPIMLRDQFGGQHQARTQFVMIRGAIVASTSNLRVGHKLTIQNVKSGKSAEGHVTAIEPGIAGSSTVEIEFTGNQPDFWPVQFPSDNFHEAAPVSPKLTSADQLSLADDISAPPTASSTISTPKTSSALSAPPPREREKDLVSLADSVGQNFPSPPPVPRSLPTRTPPPTDSVAQFRAANRAAHRREKQMKVIYSVASVVALAGLALAGKSWMSHRAEGVDRGETIVQPAPVPKKTSPPSSPSTTVSASATVANMFAQLKSAPAKVIARIKLPGTTSKTDLAAADTTLSTPAGAAASSKPSAEWAPAGDTQVTVRHGSSMASARKAADDPGEEPVALPLSTSINPASQPNPAEVNAVVAQMPSKAAVLAPVTPKQRLMTPAKLIFSVPAQYPAVARQLRTQGEVVLVLDVDASGSVSDAKVVSGAPMLRNAALDAVRRWKYEPATLGDKAVASTQTVKVDFQLR